MNKQQPMGISVVKTILERVDISPILYDRGHFALYQKGDGYLLQFRYCEVDSYDPTGEPQEQRCRKWYISPYSTTTEVVRTAYKAVQASMEHRLGEHFTYQGKRIHDPHRDVDALVSICNEQDERIPL